MHAKNILRSGLRYEDLLVEADPIVQEALELAHPDVIKGRLRRIKRASDLSYKQKLLQDYAPHMELEPFKEELYPDMLKIKKRDEEIALLNLHKL